MFTDMQQIHSLALEICVVGGRAAQFPGHSKYSAIYRFRLQLLARPTPHHPSTTHPPPSTKKKPNQICHLFKHSEIEVCHQGDFGWWHHLNTYPPHSQGLHNLKFVSVCKWFGKLSKEGAVRL